MAQPSKAVKVDNTFRRKFDKEEYLERARKEAEKKSKSKAKVERKPLKKRDNFEVDLESRLGKTQVVTPIAPVSQQAGYICSVCECVVKDSANYLDHINGKKHQRALGMSMRVERASVQQVQQQLQLLKKRKSFTEQDFDDRILKQQQEEEERKRQRRERKKKVTEEEDEADPDVAAFMGFGGFGSSKKNEKDTAILLSVVICPDRYWLICKNKEKSFFPLPNLQIHSARCWSIMCSIAIKYFLSYMIHPTLCSFKYHQSNYNKCKFYYLFTTL